MTAKILRSGPTSWRTARTLCAAASTSTSSKVGRAGASFIEAPGAARLARGSRGRGLQIVELPAGAPDHRGQGRGGDDHVEAPLPGAAGERPAREVPDRLAFCSVRP